MSFHDAVLETVHFDEDRVLTVMLSGVPGRDPSAKLAVRLEGFQTLLMCGTIERDWFLSDVVFLTALGEKIDIRKTPHTQVGRVLVLGTNGAFIEVIGGRLVAEDV